MIIIVIVVIRGEEYTSKPVSLSSPSVSLFRCCLFQEKGSNKEREEGGEGVGGR